MFEFIIRLFASCLIALLFANSYRRAVLNNKIPKRYQLAVVLPLSLYFVYAVIINYFGWIAGVLALVLAGVTNILFDSWLEKHVSDFEETEDPPSAN